MIDFNNPKKKKQANTKLSVALGEYEAASALIEKKFYRESVIHLYFCSFYLSQAVCADLLKPNPSHKNVETQLNKKYGKGGGEVPKLYVKLHGKLHKTRNEMSYQTPIVPPEELIKQLYKTLSAYVECVNKKLSKVATLDIISDIYNRNQVLVKDFSYDIYCPKTYSHHNRITFWQPPFYLHVYTTEKLMREARAFIKKLKIRKSENYVLGLNSRVDQYSSNHYLMLDFDSLDTAVESALDGIRGVLLKSGRGYHFIGYNIIEGQKAWEKEMRRISRIKQLKGKIDQDHIDISIRRGYSTLRITNSPIKPNEPIFYKEI